MNDQTPSTTTANTPNTLPPGHPLASVTPTFTAPAAAQPPAESKPATTENAETDWKVEAQKWEKRAKENFEKAKKFDEFEEASKSEAQKLAERLAKAEADATSAQADALRYRAAAKYGISDEDASLFLTGSDAETLERQAARLAASVSQTPGHVGAEGRIPSTPLNGDGLEQALRAKLGIT